MSRSNCGCDAHTLGRSNNNSVTVVRGPRGDTGMMGLRGPMGTISADVEIKFKIVAIEGSGDSDKEIKTTFRELYLMVEELRDKNKELEERVFELEEILTYAPGSERVKKVKVHLEKLAVENDKLK